MGEHAIRKASDEAEGRAFTRAILNDIRALEELIAQGRIETGVTRVGAEQEMYLVDSEGMVAPVAEKLLERLDDDQFTSELARFNLEANFDPQPFGGDFLARLEQDIAGALAKTSAAAEELGAQALLIGILPTLGPADLTDANLMPQPRYKHLNEALFRARDSVTVKIDGIEAYEGQFGSVILEGANTSFQLHLQVDPAEAVDRYNLMQLVTAPLLAAAANSPVLLGKRLWHETRIAVFERSLDERSGSQLARGHPTRVWFGDRWLEGSIVELFRDNAARFPAILVCDVKEDSLDVVAAGGVPELAALMLHNGTVWRWNRPCYGVKDGVAHLRIENRVLPAGPTAVDEVANAALLFGMMAGLPQSCGNVAERLSFADAKANFLAAARQGLEAEFDWLDGRRIDARELLLDELLPAAREGLAVAGVPDAHVDKYLGIMEARVASGRTGAGWALESFRAQRGRAAQDVWHDVALAMLENQRGGRPVHEWALAPERNAAPKEDEPTVASFMTTDLFTVRPDDVIDLALSVMEWKHIRHIPVEGEDGELVGLLTVRDLLRASQGDPGRTPAGEGGQAPAAVRSLMHTDIVRIGPQTTLRQAMTAMLQSDLGCLLVVADDRLAGIVTERDLVAEAGKVLERNSI